MQTSLNMGKFYVFCSLKELDFKINFISEVIILEDEFSFEKKGPHYRFPKFTRN